MNQLTSYLLPLAVTIVLLTLQWTIVAPAIVCSKGCTCQLNNVDCKYLSLIRVPDDIPRNTETLDLSNNKISSIGNSSFGNLTNLLTLDLGENAIKVIEPAAFYQLSSLDTLVLSENDIDELNALHFYHLGSLTKLWIMENPNLNIDINAFQNLRSITEIIADGNLITDNYDFSDLVYLEVLQLSKCKVRKFHSDNFRRLTNLKKLNLSGNELTEFPVDILDDKEALEELNLAGNMITNLQRYDFRNNPNLIHLDVSQNDIESLEGVKFENLSALNLLDLSYNKIQVLPVDLLKNFSPLLFLRVKMPGNPIACDCHLKWLSELPDQITFDARCETPFVLKNYDVMNLSPDSLRCAPSEKKGAALFRVVTYGESVTLSCPVTGDPFPDVTWLYHNQSTALNIPVASSSVRPSIEGNKVFFNLVTFDMAGLYICNATNDLGSVKVAVGLSVVPVVAADRITMCSCQKPIFLFVILSVAVMVSVGVSFAFYRKFIRAARTQRNMNYTTLRETEGEAL